MKNLKNLIFGIGISGIIGSCSVNRNFDLHPTSVYYGKIDEDSVKFTKEFNKKGIVNTLAVIKPNNKVIIYRDVFYNDYLIENIQVYENKNCRTFYKDDKNDKPLIEEAQKQFNNYLQKINDSKIILK